MYDLVIRGGSIVDGSGQLPYPGDVAVSGGRIAAIGRLDDGGREEIDATGQVVTPGFIDGHTHMDAQVFWDELGSSSCWHGVTTVVMGHCGFTLAPAGRDERHLVVRNLERAEDISGAAMEVGIPWSWTSFAEYLDAVDRLPKAINYAANVGHSALRTHVMGERAFTEPAGDADLEGMAAVLAGALAAGGYGLSTSRTHHHETSDDRPVASRLAEWSEVCALVDVVGRSGHGIFQLVQDPPSEPDQAAYDQRLIDLAVSTGVPIAIGATSGGRVLGLLDAAAAAGGRMFGLTHPRGIGSMSSFRSRMPFDALPEWAPVRALPLDEQKRALADPDVRQRLIWSAHHGAYGRAIGAEARKPDFDRMRVLDRPVPPNPTVNELARSRGVDPVEAMIDLALETDLEQFFVQTFAPFDVAGVRAAMKHPRTVTTFSDSGAHVSQISDSSIQTHVLAYWVRQRGDFTLEEAVRMLTLAPAQAWGFTDRGLLREGAIADLNVFDPETVAPAMPRLVHDLPAGQPRIEQRSVGFRATVVGGEVTIVDGQPTGRRPGRLIRGGQS